MLVSVTDKYELTYIAEKGFKIKHLPSNKEKYFEKEINFFFTESQIVEAIPNASNTAANREMNSKAMQAAIHFQHHDGTVYFPAGIYHYDEIYLKKPRIKLIGTGELSKGTLYIGHDKLHQQHSNFEIEGLTFREAYEMPDSITNNKPLIVIRNVEGGKISNCQFYGGTAAISVEAIDYNPADTSKLWWHAGKIMISNNQFKSNNHALKVELHPNISRYSAGDIQFINNMTMAMRKSTIHCVGQDGLIVQGNTFFSSQGKQIYISKGHYLNISGNNIFENAEESIYLKNVRDFHINGNTIVNPGWAKSSSTKHSAIRVQNWGLYGGGDNYDSNKARGRGIISNNLIRWPSLYGIDLRGARMVTVSNNMIEFPNEDEWKSSGKSTNHERPSDSQYAIFADNHTTLCQFIDNITIGHPNKVYNCCLGTSNNVWRQNAQMGLGID